MTAAGLLAACVAISLVAFARPQTGRQPAAREATWLVGQLEATEWHDSYTAWKAKHSSIPCRVFHGDGSALFIVDLWTYRCTDVEGSGRASRYFYLLDPSTPPESHLDQFQGEILQSSALPLSVIQEIHNEIESRLTTRYGQPDAPQSAPAEVAAWGAGDWHLLRIWRQSDRNIYLYLRETPGEKVAVGLLARDRALATASTDEGRQLLLNEQPDAAFEDQIDSRLATDLSKVFSGITVLLGDSDNPPAAGAVFKTIANVILRSAKEPPDLRAEMLLAADRLVDHWHLPATAKLSGDLQLQMERLKTGAGMHFEWDPIKENWVYHHDLLWTVSLAAPQTEWGQYAFFLLLEHGWDTSGVCRAGADQFRTVIEQGEKFLQEFPGSPARLPIMLLLGHAYETGWSLSQAAACSPVTDTGLTPCAPAPSSAHYQSGTATYPEKAIEEYKALLQADPETYGTPEIRRHLARLELGVDTNERRFYCLDTNN